MNSTLIYKGFHGIVEYSSDDECLIGEIIGITDLITFIANTGKEIKGRFEEAVDDYLETCNIVGKEPMKSFTGSFNVRIDPETHLKAVIKAKTEGKTLNRLVKEALEKEVNETVIPT